MTPAQLKKAAKEGKIDDESHLKGFTPVRYVYFGRKEGTNVHDGVVSVGYTISDDGQLLRIAIAFCSPEDIFSKKNLIFHIARVCRLHFCEGAPR